MKWAAVQIFLRLHREMLGNKNTGLALGMEQKWRDQ